MLMSPTLIPSLLLLLPTVLPMPDGEGTKVCLEFISLSFLLSTRLILRGPCISHSCIFFFLSYFILVEYMSLIKRWLVYVHLEHLLDAEGSYVDLWNQVLGLGGPLLTYVNKCIGLWSPLT